MEQNLVPESCLAFIRTCKKKEKKLNVSLKGKKGSFGSRARRTFKGPVKSVHVAASALLGKCFPLKSAYSTQELNTRGEEKSEILQTFFFQAFYWFSDGWLMDRGRGGGLMGDKLVWGWGCSHTAVHLHISALICQLSAVWTATCFTEEGDPRPEQALWKAPRPDGFRCQRRTTSSHMRVWRKRLEPNKLQIHLFNHTSFCVKFHRIHHAKTIGSSFFSLLELIRSLSDSPWFPHILEKRKLR